MKNLINQFALVVLGLFIGASVFIGCGGDDAGDSGADTEAAAGAETSENSSASEDASESTSADFEAGEYGEWFEHLVVTIEGVQTEEDVKKAEPEIAKSFKHMAAAVKADKNWAQDQNDERINALSDRLGKHMSELGQSNLQAAMAVSMVIAQHGSEVMQAMGMSMMGHKAENMDKMNSALEEANKAIEKYKESTGN